MRTSALMTELLELAKSRNLNVRREPMSRGTGAGGLCVLKSQPTVFIDDRAQLDAQLEVLAMVLRRFDWSEATLSPSARAALKLDALPAARKPRPARARAAESG